MLLSYWPLIPICTAGEKLEVVKKQLKVQKKEEKATPSKDSSKKKLKKGIRIRKGVQIRVSMVHPA